MGRSNQNLSYEKYDIFWNNTMVPRKFRVLNTFDLLSKFAILCGDLQSVSSGIFTDFIGISFYYMACSMSGQD